MRCIPLTIKAPPCWPKGGKRQRVAIFPGPPHSRHCLLSVVRGVSGFGKSTLNVVKFPGVPSLWGNTWKAMSKAKGLAVWFFVVYPASGGNINNSALFVGASSKGSVSINHV